MTQPLTKPYTLFNRLALLALAFFPIAVLGVRLEFWYYRISILLLALAFLLGLVCAVSALVLWWRGRTRDSVAQTASARLTLMIALVPVVVLGLQAAKASSLPFIHDITTDTANPPQFVAIVQQRAGAENGPAYPGEEVAQQQRAGYPDIQTLRTDDTPAKAFEQLLSQVNGYGWDVVAADAASGRIEAVDTTSLFGFKDDIVIRVQAHGESGSLVDVRSLSRVGKSDLGANAKRIRKVLADFQQL